MPFFLEDFFFFEIASKTGKNWAIFLFFFAQARSQKFASEGLGAEPQPPETNGGVGAKPPTLKIFAIFCKNNLLLELF